MLAELHYPSSTSAGAYDHIMDDIAKVMTGTLSKASLSPILDQDKSSLTGAAGNWIAVTTDTAAEIHSTGSTPRLFRNTCMFSGKTKYLKFAFGSVSSNFMFFAGVNAYTVSSSTAPVPYVNRISSSPTQLTNPPVSSTQVRPSGLSGDQPMVVKLFVTRELVIVNFGLSGITLGDSPLVIMDYPPSIMEPAVPLVNTVVGTNTTLTDLSGTSYYGYLNYSYGPFTNTQIINSVLYKNEGFVSTGTMFWLIPLGITSMKINNVTYQIPWYNASDDLKVWMTNVNAFGNNGDTFRTALGDLCKFGPYMVEVR